MLGEFEYLLITAAAGLGERAYGAAIREEIEVTTGRRCSIGALYTTIDRLGVCREYVSTSLTLRWRYIDQHQNRKREPALPHWLPPYARKALFRSSCNGFALLIP